MELKHIPGTKDFYASCDGRIFDKNGLERMQYRNGDGYKTASVLLDNGKWQTFGSHRLVALAFIPCPSSPETLTVNHRDLNIENNHYTNLEWLTVAENNIHAALLRGSKDRPVIIAKDPNGNYSFIDNIQKAAEKFNSTIFQIWDCIKNEEKINDWTLSYSGSKKAIPNELRKPSIVNPNLTKVKIKFYDVLKKTTKVFDSLHSAAVYFNTSASHIFQSISNNGKKRVFQKRYLVVRENDEFPVITKEEFLNIISSGGKDVIAYNVEQNKYYIYASASSFVKENNLSKKAVTVCLKKEQLRLINGWYFAYLNSPNVERLKQLAVVQNG